MRVVFRCDAGPVVGAGHVMRCVALAEELASRGVRPVFVCDVEELPWVREQLDRRGFDVLPASTDVREPRPAAVVLDSYLLPPGVSTAWRAEGVPVLALVDGSLRGRVADLYVDQNLGAEQASVDLPAGSRRLAGLDYAMLRDETLAARPAAPPVDGGRGAPEVVAVFGGTDAHGAAPVLVDALAATGLPFTATIVSATDALAAAVRAVPSSGEQHVRPIPPTSRLAELVASADLVISAAGSSTWELLSLGAAAAVVRVADNQREGYDRTAATGAVAGLGALADIRRSPTEATAVLVGLLTSPEDRAAMRRRAWHLVDGAGRRRVADALLGTITRTRSGQGRAVGELAVE